MKKYSIPFKFLTLRFNSRKHKIFRWMLLAGLLAYLSPFGRLPGDKISSDTIVRVQRESQQRVLLPIHTVFPFMHFLMWVRKLHQNGGKDTL